MTSEQDAATHPHLLMVGASCSQVCGVRDHAAVLQGALTQQGASVTRVWWERDWTWSPQRTYTELSAWLAWVQEAALARRPDGTLWHYSAFTYGHRGASLFPSIVARRLARLGAPLTVLAHELVYPWGVRGWRGRVVALTQRAGLLPVVRHSRRLLVTVEEYIPWLQSRLWLPSRPVTCVPVYSTLPTLLDEVASPPRTPGCYEVGIFGYGHSTFLPEPVLESVSLLRDRSIEVLLMLIGAPGEASPAGQTWRAGAQRHGCADAIRFSGILPAQELARSLQAVDVVVFPDWPGPMSRRTSLAAALALCKPVLAFDGPHRWEALVKAGGVLLVDPVAADLATSLEQLLLDPQRQRDQGRRGLAFYRRHMAPDLAAATLLDALRSDDQAPPWAPTRRLPRPAPAGTVRRRSPPLSR